MLNFIWPIGLVVICNVAYQVCAKSVPEGMNPFASLTVTYFISTLISAALYFVFSKGENPLHAYAKLNWAPVVLGIVVVGLEAGFIFTYKAGWPVSAASIVQSSFLAVALLFVGRLLYQESLSWNKLVGAAICMIGLIFINRK